MKKAKFRRCRNFGLSAGLALFTRKPLKNETEVQGPKGLSGYLWRIEGISPAFRCEIRGLGFPVSPAADYRRRQMGW